MVSTVEPDERQERAVDSLEFYLRLTTRARGQRDPIGWLQDQLLDLRAAVLKP